LLYLMECKIMTSKTLMEIIKLGSDNDVAIGTIGRTPMQYSELRTLMENTVLALRRLGIYRNQRVAIVLPNGPEMASAFISVAAGATAAPLNPAYREEEFSFYLKDLNAKALLVDSGSKSPSIKVAKDLNIPVYKIDFDQTGPAGNFSIPILESLESVIADSIDYAEPEDVGLVLHTSGTTSRPKIVPLSQKNICTSACNIAEVLGLTSEDRGLNIMPLFHIHGLIAAVLSSLSAGSSIYCSPGFNALKVYGWFKEVAPTWYTAVPTMHQAILLRANRNSDIIEQMHLRFIRSSSSSLPPQVMAELETVFVCPVIESYGMTEAAHQMASNPLPPAERKPGSVGVAAGPEVAIMGADNNLLSSGKTGEIVIRGDNVTLGYENNPIANSEAFTNGWFRTGDQGVMDEAGYLQITGRLKEIINRGGEKISPREVDEVILDHRAVDQVVTFAYPHEKLGEEVGVAIVIKEGFEISEKEVREFAKKRLADFKVPRKVIFIDEIPKGATGKLQRIGLHEKLGV
jgi:acyl-CoA synthetase (AMP-forming)/AMP-acid ligase II